MHARTPNADFKPPDRDYDRFVTGAITFGDQGLNLAIVYLPYNPPVVEKLAVNIVAAYRESRRGSNTVGVSRKEATPD